MSYPAYLSYKASNISWIGFVPDHWKIERLKSSTDSVQNGTWGSEPNGQGDLICVRVADFDRNRFTANIENPTYRCITDSEKRGRVLKAGDLLLEKSGGGETQPVGAVVLYQYSQDAVCSNFVARVVVSSGYDSRFLTYLHAHLYACRINTRSIKQTTGIQNLDSQSYFDERVAFPTFSEQLAIANFLDQETAKIDTIIAKQQQLIENLQEKRQALISHVVTKGLNPNTPMQDSGIEWLGNIPAHWDSIRFGYLLQRIETGWTPNSEQRLAEEDEWAVLKVGCVRDGKFYENEHKALAPDVQPLSDIEVRPGDLLMSRANTLELVGSVGLIKQTRPHLTLCDKTFRLILRSDLLVEYANYLLLSRVARNQIELAATGASASMKNITQESVRAIYLLLPPKKEQLEIVNFLDNQLLKIDTLIDKAQSVIALLQERRTSLISAAVTGKIDVRAYGNHEP